MTVMAAWSVLLSDKNVKLKKLHTDQEQISFASFAVCSLFFNYGNRIHQGKNHRVESHFNHFVHHVSVDRPIVAGAV